MDVLLAILWKNDFMKLSHSLRFERIYLVAHRWMWQCVEWRNSLWQREAQNNSELHYTLVHSQF